MKNNKTSAFTLVELIVVITILAVLATVAFISFQGYTSSSRDSVRLADLKNISKSFEINRTKGIDFPLPDKKVDISSSGTIFQYQGELSQNILEKDLNIFDGGVDPLTGDNYGYAVNSARNKFQVIGFLENQDSVANISLNKSFADNSDKYAKSSGDTLGILLDETTNEIIVQSGSLVEIDVQINIDDYNIILDNNFLIKNENNLKEFFQYRYNKYANCKAILYHGESHGSGLYTINPTGIIGQEFQVYCDMENDGGGWTRINTNMADLSYLNGTSVNISNQDIISGTNNGQSCQSSLETYNIMIDNIKGYYSDMIFYLYKKDTIMQCASISGVEEYNPFTYKVYYNQDNKWKIFNTNWNNTVNDVCSWEDGIWGNSPSISENNSYAIGELNQNWKVHNKIYGEKSIKFLSRCSSSLDNGEYEITIYVK